MQHRGHGPSEGAGESFGAEMARRRADGERERRRLRIGLLAAAAVHVAVFAANWPAVVKATGAAEDRSVVVYRLRSFELRPPGRRPLDVAIPRARPVPAPDPSPRNPEPLDRPAAPTVDRDLDVDRLPPFVAPPAPDPPPLREVVVAVHVAPPEVLHRVQPQSPEAVRRVNRADPGRRTGGERGKDTARGTPSGTGSRSGSEEPWTGIGKNPDLDRDR